MVMFMAFPFVVGISVGYWADVVWLLVRRHWSGAELGPQVPLIQVFTPKRGSTQACRTIQTTRMPKGMKISIFLPPSGWMVFIDGNVPIIRHNGRKKLTRSCSRSGPRCNS